MKALGQAWHPEHFSCRKCGEVFSRDQAFHEKGGFPYCKSCYVDLVCSKCAGCCLPITDRALKAMEADWHVECFVCQVRKERREDGISQDRQILRLCDIQIFLPSRYTSRYGKNIAIHEPIHDTQRCQKVSRYTSQYTIHTHKKTNVKTQPIYKTLFPDQYC